MRRAVAIVGVVILATDLTQVVTLPHIAEQTVDFVPAPAFGLAFSGSGNNGTAPWAASGGPDDGNGVMVFSS
jgi:hypothetical protein